MIKITNQSVEELANLLLSHKETSLSIKINIKTSQDISYLKTIEDGLSQLKHLTDLQIKVPTNCVITNLGYSHISNAIKNLTNLVQLEISIQNQCYLNNEGLIILKGAIQNLRSLHTLKFKVVDNSKITSEIGKLFIDSLSGLSNIKVLELSFEHISKPLIDQGDIHFWQGIQNLNNLEILSISMNDNNYSEDDLRELFQSILSFQKLNSLSFTSINNQFQTDILNLIMHYIGQMINLKSLRIDLPPKQICMSNTQKEDLLKNLRNLKQLEILKMKSISNYLMANDLEEYLRLIGSYSNLKKIKLFCSWRQKRKIKTLQSNYFLNLTNILSFKLESKEEVCSDKFIFDLSNCLKQMHSLNVLKLYLNQTSDKACDNLGESLYYLQTLTSLKLIIKLSSQNESLLINNLKHLTNLRDLAIKFQNRTEENSIYEAISYLVNLQTLALQIDDSDSICKGQVDLNLFSVTLRNFKQLRKLQVGLTIDSLDDQKKLELLETAFSELSLLESLKIILVVRKKGEGNVQARILNNLKNLKELDINQMDNRLRLFDNPNLQQNLCSLESVRLRFQEISEPQQFIELLKQLGSNLPNLKRLDIGSHFIPNSFDPKQFTSVCSKFTNLKKLTLLVLGRDMINYYTKGIEQIKSLKSLNLRFHKSNNKNSEDAEQLGKALSRLDNLQKIKIAIQSDYFDFLHTDFDKEILTQINSQTRLKQISFFVNDYKNLTVNNIIYLNEFNVTPQLPYKANKDGQNDKTNLIDKTVECEIIQRKINHPSLSKQYPSQLILKSTPVIGDKSNPYLIDKLDNLEFDYLKNVQLYYSFRNETYLPFKHFSNFKRLNNLRDLHITLYGVILSEEQIHSLTYHLKSLMNIEFLHLDISKFHSFDYVLFEQLKRLVNLLKLTLKIYISNQGAISLGNSLSALVNLEDCSLQFSKNRALKVKSSKFNIEGIQSILCGLKHLTKLKNLELNFWTDQPILVNENEDYYFDFFKDMKQLRQFQLNYKINESFKSLQQSNFYTSLSELKYLQQLELTLKESNALNQQALDAFIESINSFKQLRSLKVSISVESSGTNKIIRVSKSLSQQFNQCDYLPLIINTKKNKIIFEKKLDCSKECCFKIKSNNISDMELSFMEELNENIVVRLKLSSYEILSSIQNCSVKKMIIQMNNAIEEQPFNKLCAFLQLNKNIYLLMLEINLNLNFIENDLEQIANQLIKCESLKLLCLLVYQNKQQSNYYNKEGQPLNSYQMLKILKTLSKLQQLQEFYFLTNSLPINLQLTPIIKRTMKRLITFSQNVCSWTSLDKIEI